MMTKGLRQTVFSLTLLGMMGLTDATDAASYTSTMTAIPFGQNLTVTPLGDGYRLTTDSTGYTTAITSADGKSTYVYDKYPVYHEMVANNYNNNWEYNYNGGQMVTYTVLYNNYGSESFDYYPRGAGDVFSPYSVFQGRWYMDDQVIGGPLTSPVNDFNIHGQAVGSNGSVGNMGVGDFGNAAASTQFGFLQNDFPSSLGINFYDAIGIDDLGQIIATGSLNGQYQDFLITPGDGPTPIPTPAPEPSTLAILGFGLSLLGLRSIRRRRVIRLT